MKVIGLTGGIGSGKSTVSRFLAELGVMVIDADRVGHEALKNAGIRQEIVGAFGEQVLDSHGEVDRARLSRVVFHDAGALEDLNRIMHPRIHDMIKVRIDDLRRRGVGVVVLEAPLLVEAGWTSTVDQVWVTTAPESTVLRRLRERSGLSESGSLARIRSQISGEERARHADVVIDTDCSLDELKAKVTELWDRLQK